MHKGKQKIAKKIQTYLLFKSSTSENDPLNRKITNFKCSKKTDRKATQETILRSSEEITYCLVPHPDCQGFLRTSCTLFSCKAVSNLQMITTLTSEMCLSILIPHFSQKAVLKDKK